MSSNDSSTANLPWLALTIMLFGMLALASHGNELLKQTVISPGSSAALGIAADCRADELQEEQLTLQECELMVSSVRIVLSSSPDWFRGFQLALSGAGVAAALFSLITAFGVMNRQAPKLGIAAIAIGALLLLDICGFVVALNIGPLLRAQYLFPLLLWSAIHLCMLVSLVRSQAMEIGRE